MKHTTFSILTFLLISLSSCEKNDETNSPQDASGVYAVYSNGGQWSDRKAFLWKDELQTDLSNPNQKSNLYVTAVAVSSTGDVYVVGGEGLTIRQDIPSSLEYVDNVNTVLWKNGIKQNLSATPVPRWFMKGQDVDLAINSSDDVFVLGRDGSTGAGEYSIWKNGSRIIEMDESQGEIYPSKLFAKENDTYICGYIDDYPLPRKAALWKNGVSQYVNTTANFARAVYVSDNGDVYLGLGGGTLLKNNVAQPALLSNSGSTANIIYDIMGVGTDVYVLGYTTGGESIIWKNGLQLYKLSTPATPYLNIAVQSMFIKGDDVFVSGILSGNVSSSSVVIYKNGTLYKTVYNGNGILIDAPSVFVK